MRAGLYLSKIKSEHIRGAIRLGLGGKEYALPSSRCAIGARPYPRPSACASHYSSERKNSESGADVARPGQRCGPHIHAGSIQSATRQKHFAKVKPAQ